MIYIIVLIRLEIVQYSENDDDCFIFLIAQPYLVVNFF